MGGCYRDESYRSSSSYSRPATPTLISLLREVFNKGLNPNTRKQKLVEAFQKLISFCSGTLVISVPYGSWHHTVWDPIDEKRMLELDDEIKRLTKKNIERESKN